MKEAELRKYHRTFGIMLAVFIILQAGSGLLLTFEKLGRQTEAHADSGHGVIEHVEEKDDHTHDTALLKIVEAVHKKGGLPGDLLRVATAIGFIGLAASGSLIFVKIQARKKT